MEYLIELITEQQSVYDHEGLCVRYYELRNLICEEMKKYRAKVYEEAV
ncbi:hypothetical protein FACS1894184_06200 [Clostridia bacterium]|nr:hypothetical protein FACS1894184_06200 [Clostridia bacterium]